MKTECDNQIYQSQNYLRLTKECYENLLKTQQHQHEEEKHQISSNFNIEKSHMKEGFHDEKVELSSVIESQKNALESLRIESEHNQAARDRITEGFEEEKESMKNNLQGLKDHFHEEIRIMQDQHSQGLHKKDRAIDEIKTTKEMEERQIEEKYVAEILRREEEHRSLKGDVETLKGAPIKRSHFKTMGGRELSLRFQDLATEIDDFSRVRWDNRRESTWPFPDKVLRKLENERRSKQHVIQNTIWVIFYERIFCTPFRVLGTEGELMEQDWIEKYGQGELLHPIRLIRQLSYKI